MKYLDTLQFARDNRKNQTQAEKFVWERLRNRKLHGLKFNRQFLINYKEVIGNKLYYIVDFHNFEYKLILEIDGPIHLEQKEYDVERQADLESLGYKVLRFTNEEVLLNWEDVKAKILSVLNDVNREIKEK